MRADWIARVGAYRGLVLEQTSWIAAAAGVLVAVGSAVIALLARNDARRSAAAAQEVADIERERRHGELTPRLRVVAQAQGPGSTRVQLQVTLDGPDGVDALDELQVRVRDDQEHVATLAGGATQEELNATIWGPYRFTPGVDGADRLGQQAGVFPLSRGASNPC